METEDLGAGVNDNVLFLLSGGFVHFGGYVIYSSQNIESFLEFEVWP